jgi:protease secretion system outer membrane protein
MNLILRIFLALILFRCSLNCFAADALDLSIAHQKAFNYDATFRAAMKNNQAQSQLTNQAISAFLPQIKLSAYEGRGMNDRTDLSNNQSTQSTYDSKNYNLSIRQSIFDKSNFDNFKKAKFQEESSNFNLEVERINLTAKVIGEFLDLLLNLDYVNYADYQKVSIDSQLEQAKRRYESGLGTVTEISQAEAYLQEHISNEFTWKNGLEVAKRNLEKTIGIYPTNFYVLDFDRLSKRKFNLGTVDEWLVIANSNSFYIKKAKKDLETAESEISRIYAGHLPTLDLIASEAKTQSDNPITIGTKFETTSIGLQLNIPIYAGGYINSKVLQTIALRDEMQEKLNEIERATQLNVRKFFYEVSNDIAKIESLKASKNAYKEALVGTKKGFLAGIQSNTDVLNTQAKFYASQRELIKHHYKLVNDIIQLKLWSGILNENDVQILNADMSPKELIKFENLDISS